MSFYVKRTIGERTGWTGPIRSEIQAGKEAAAWESIPGWTASVLPSSVEVKQAVRAWQNAKKVTA